MAYDDKPSWFHRRIVVYASLIFFGALVAYIVLMDKQSGTSEAIALASIAAMASIIGSYVFGAAWQDVTAMRHRPRGELPPHRPEMPSPVPEDSYVEPDK